MNRPHPLNWWQKSAIVALWLIFGLLCLLAYFGGEADKDRRAGEVRQREAILKAAKETSKALKGIDARLKRMEKAKK